MTVGEYEERFRGSAASLHETFVAMQGRGARRRRSQRFWAAVALTGAIIVACTALVSWLPAQAQFLGPTLEFNVDLRKQDLDIIHHTVNEQVHGKPIGTTAKWSNPESQNSGKIALVRKFNRNGQQCETLDYRLITKRKPVGPQHFRLGSCLQPDGQWRLI